jgi:lysozyme family protein
MAQFEQAILKVLKHEGGFVNHPNDPGGATNFGISLRFLKGVGDWDGDGWLDGDLDKDGDVDVHDIQMMTLDQAEEFYRIHFWDRNGYDQIEDQALATKVFDLTVNMGNRRSHRLLQRACRACGFRIADDGYIGPITLKTVRNADEEALMTGFRSEAAGYYRGLVIARPKFESFIDGWLNRAYA